MEITEQDKLNNPGVDEHAIQTIKEQYHFHRISSASLSGSVLFCVFAVDEDLSSIFFTPEENNKAPVREYEVGNVEGDVSITSDGLAVRIGEKYISSEEIWDQPQ